MQHLVGSVPAVADPSQEVEGQEVVTGSNINLDLMTSKRSVSLTFTSSLKLYLWLRYNLPGNSPGTAVPRSPGNEDAAKKVFQTSVFSQEFRGLFI